MEEISEDTRQIVSGLGGDLIKVKAMANAMHSCKSIYHDAIETITCTSKWLTLQAHCQRSTAPGCCA